MFGAFIRMLRKQNSQSDFIASRKQNFSKFPKKLSQDPSVSKELKDSMTEACDHDLYGQKINNNYSKIKGNITNSPKKIKGGTIKPNPEGGYFNEWETPKVVPNKDLENNFDLRPTKNSNNSNSNNNSNNNSSTNDNRNNPPSNDS